MVHLRGYCHWSVYDALETYSMLAVMFFIVLQHQV
jgi:hypothetical protein